MKYSIDRYVLVKYVFLPFIECLLEIRMTHFPKC